jgi:hypothetical protein
VLADCEVCSKTKKQRHKPYRKLQPIIPSEQPWRTIGFDLIVKLPLSKEPLTGAVYNSIWTICNKLIKYTYFIPFKEASSTEDLVYMFMRNIRSQYRLPDHIITDRVPVYISRFW